MGAPSMNVSCSAAARLFFTVEDTPKSNICTAVNNAICARNGPECGGSKKGCKAGTIKESAKFVSVWPKDTA